VGELRKALEGVSDDVDIVVRAWNDDAHYWGTIGSVEVQHAHDEDDTEFLAIDCGPDEEPERHEPGVVGRAFAEAERRAAKEFWRALTELGKKGRSVMADLRNEIEQAINRHSAEQRSGTPDFILSEYLIDCLAAFDKATSARDEWGKQKRVEAHVPDRDGCKAKSDCG